MTADHKKVMYFIGIGGIGMSALARYFNRQGAEIHGYDKTPSALTETLEQEGMKIHYEIDAAYVPGNTDVVVYTPAIPDDHDELIHCKMNGFEVLKRSEMLGRISHEKRTIAVAGTHGKTSTSALVAYLLRSGNKEISAFLGGIAKNFDSNYVFGADEWIVVEADEYDRSFWHLDPEVIILNSIDPDHLDVYGDADEMKKGFEHFLTLINDNGLILMHDEIKEMIDLQIIQSIIKRGVQVETFGLEKGDHMATNIRVEGHRYIFDYAGKGSEIVGLNLGMIGNHNVLNCTAAIAASLHVGLSGEDIRKGVESFAGILRRFETIWDKGGKWIVDDYAHHPRELKAAIETFRTTCGEEKIAGIFQPHLFTRTRDFHQGFAKELDQLDVPILVEIYPAREEPVEGVSSQMIFDKMQNDNKILTTKAELIELLKQLEIDQLIIMGAGDIDVMIPEIKEAITQ